jgi:ribosome-associated toxin RatA of RatAB toxin-antitoxin module
MISLGPMPTSARSRTLDVLVVRAPRARILDLAADVEAWPRHLSHYRYVRFRERAANGGLVEMSANRPFGPFDWPTFWTSLMEIRREDAPAIRFRHVEGITTRMEVQWTFEADAGGTRVTIEHLWDGPRWPLIGLIAARGVIGPVFVHGIASRTLAGLARVAEQHQTSL